MTLSFCWKYYFLLWTKENNNEMPRNEVTIKFEPTMWVWDRSMHIERNITWDLWNEEKYEMVNKKDYTYTDVVRHVYKCTQVSSAWMLCGGVVYTKHYKRQSGCFYYFCFIRVRETLDNRCASVTCVTCHPHFHFFILKKQLFYMTMIQHRPGTAEGDKVLAIVIQVNE